MAELKLITPLRLLHPWLRLHGLTAVAELKHYYFATEVTIPARLHGLTAVAELKPCSLVRDRRAGKRGLHGLTAVAELKPGS